MEAIRTENRLIQDEVKCSGELASAAALAYEQLETESMRVRLLELEQFSAGRFYFAVTTPMIV